MGKSSDDVPFLISFDWGQAFPSIDQDWLFDTLGAMDAPKGLQDAMRVNYDGVVSLAASRSRAILYAVRSGILQGDPASGTLFVLAAHPFGQYLKRHLDGKKRGLSRWCADDLGSTVSTSRGLATLARVFRAAQTLAGLVIKPAKCFAIPLGDPRMPDMQLRAREALATPDPAWAAFPIVDCLEYLGVLMGPGVTLEMQWSAPLKKYVDRVGDIARSRADAHAAVLLYQERCIPVLAYKAQLVEHPLNLKRVERGIFRAIAHAQSRSRSCGASSRIWRAAAVSRLQVEPGGGNRSLILRRPSLLRWRVRRRANANRL